MSMIDVAIGIVMDQDKVLICRRPSHVQLGGYWEFPGGKCEPGERPEHCVQRELKEEVGLEVAVIRALPVIEHQYPSGPIRLHPFLCQFLRGQAAPLAADEARWVQIQDLSNYRFPPANDRLLAALINKSDGKPTPY